MSEYDELFENMGQVAAFTNACANASRQYYEMGDEQAAVMAQAYAWMGRGAFWAVQILCGEADPETAFNDVIRTCVKGFSQDDSNEVVEMLARIWNHEGDES